MPQPQTHEVEHEITVRAPATEVYRLVADVENWPRVFPPSVFVQVLETDGARERIQIWATANDEAKTWTSRRELDPEALRVHFRQERSSPPVGAMGGTWVIEPVSITESRVRLLHDYRPVEDDPAQLAWIEQAVDRNSRSELAALAANAERLTGAGELLLDFEDSVEIAGSAKDAYDFVNEADRWTERLPHVARVHLAEDTPGLQVLEMDTMTKDGSVHTTKSVRVTFPHDRIAYKQTQVPALMTLHTGVWTFKEPDQGASDGRSDRVTATSQHTVVLNPANITTVLGPDAGVPEAREFVRNALSGNSLATLQHAKEYAEARR